MIEKLDWKFNRNRDWWEIVDKLNEIIEVVNGHEIVIHPNLHSKKAEEE